LYGFPLKVKQKTKKKKRFNSYLNNKTISPELSAQNWEIIEENPQGIDSYGIGVLLYEIYNERLDDTTHLTRNNKIPKELQQVYKKLLSKSSTSRPDMNTVLSNDYFLTEMVDTQIFLEEITLKDEFDTNKFLEKLTRILDEFPRNNCKYKILPLLLNTLKYGSNGSKSIVPILKIGIFSQNNYFIGKMMDEEEYKTIFIPSIIDCFENEDRIVRINLLSNLNSMIQFISEDIIIKKIYPNIVKGFVDTSPQLREATVKSMVLLYFTLLKG
jgi:SCY1-like protein 1